MKEKILITGGTGLVGTRLSAMLKALGFEVAYLSRTKKDSGEIFFLWNVENDKIDQQAIQWADHVIHLAGAGVFEKSWSKDYKNEIIRSRIRSTEILRQEISRQNKPLKSFISASAVGLYGFDTGDHWLHETRAQGSGFLAQVVADWEKSVDEVMHLGIRVCKIRIGIVLSEKGGALQQMMQPVKYFVGSPLGTGTQYIPWIHIDDLCGIFIKAIQDKNMKGAFNAAAPAPVTNAVLMKELATVLRKPLFMPNVPAFVLKLILGKEKAQIILGSNRVSAEKIVNTGYKFKFTELHDALKNLLK